MSYKNIIRSNADLIVALRQRIGETGAKRDESEERWQQWVSACSEFRARYSQLAFLGGVETARERLRSGDSASIDGNRDWIELKKRWEQFTVDEVVEIARHWPAKPTVRHVRLER